MAALIKGLVSHVGEAQAGRTTPDFYLAAAMLDYIQVIPERLHHPKEDEYLFRFLRSRCVEAGILLDSLAVEHIEGAGLLADLRDKLDTSREAGSFSAVRVGAQLLCRFLVGTHAQGRGNRATPGQAAPLDGGVAGHGLRIPIKPRPGMVTLSQASQSPNLHLQARRHPSVLNAAFNVNQRS